MIGNLMITSKPNVIQTASHNPMIPLHTKGVLSLYCFHHFISYKWVGFHSALVTGILHLMKKWKISFRVRSWGLCYGGICFVQDNKKLELLKVKILSELLPEDTDEPERLELLDAAIPTLHTA